MPMLTVSKEFSFEAAHSLPHLPKEHKCHHTHGHSYKVKVVCRGPLDEQKQWVVDYADISASVDPLIAQLDHKNLNDIMPCSTAESLAIWFYTRLMATLPWLHAVEIQETEKTNVIYAP